MRPSNEPLFWSIFSAGGMVAAMIIPVLIIVTGLLLPADVVDFDRLHAVFTNPIGRLVVFGLAFLTFAHWAHRFRHTLVDIGLKRYRLQIAVGCYGVALVGTAWAAVVAFT
jgi:fumarate reductase subunit D